MHPRDTDTAVCVNIWAPGTPARRLCLGSVETLVWMDEGVHFLVIRVKVCRKKDLGFGPEYILSFFCLHWTCVGDCINLLFVFQYSPTAADERYPKHDAFQTSV